MANFDAALKTLTDWNVTKGSSVKEAAGSDQLMAVRDAVLALARGDNIGRCGNMTARKGRGNVLFRSNPKGARGGAGVVFPWKVAIKSDGQCTVGRGTFVTVVPTLGGVLITNTPPPSTFFGLDTQSIFAKIRIDVSSPNFFGVKEISIESDNFGAAGDVDPMNNNEVPELKLNWDDPGVYTKGYFYLKIADGKAVAGADPPAATIEQILKQNYISFSILGTTSVVLLL